MGKILLICSSGQAIDSLASIIKEGGYSEIIPVQSGSEARRLVSNNDFDIVIINTPLSDEFGHELSMMVSDSTNSGVILLCKSEIAEDVSDKVSDYGVCVVSKPLNKMIFYHTLKLVYATRARIFGLKRENSSLQTKIEEIRTIDRAKCVLIQYLRLTEPQAHKYIEKQAMDTRQTKIQVAHGILKTYET